MEEKKFGKSSKIIFHNPNTPDESAKLLIKIAAHSISEYLLEVENNSML